jgi:protease-4
LGLVDHLGSLDDAIKAAAARAGLGERYAVRYIEKKLTFKEKLVRSLLSRAAAVLAAEVTSSTAAAPYLTLARMAAREEAELAALAAQHGVLAYAWVPQE